MGPDQDLVVLPPVADDPIFSAPLTDDDDASRNSVDPHEFAALFIRHRWSFALHARRFLSDKRDIDEVVQEGFLRLFLALPELDTELQALAYCRRTITNLCIDRYRADQRRPRLVDLESIPLDAISDAEDIDRVVRAEDAALVREALALLSPLHREALVKREIEEKTLPQIAAELDIPVEQVKHVLHRARRSLRRLLVGTHVQPGVDLDLAMVLAANRARAVHAAKPAGVAVLAVLLFLGAVLGLSSGGRSHPTSAVVPPQGSLQGALGGAVSPHVPQIRTAGPVVKTRPATTPRPARHEPRIAEGGKGGHVATVRPAPPTQKPPAVSAANPTVPDMPSEPGLPSRQAPRYTFVGALVALAAPTIDQQVRKPDGVARTLSTSVLSVQTASGNLSLQQSFSTDATGKEPLFSVSPFLASTSGAATYPVDLTVTSVGRNISGDVQIAAHAFLARPQGTGCLPALKNLSVTLTYDADLLGVTSESVRLDGDGPLATQCLAPSAAPPHQPGGTSSGQPATTLGSAGAGMTSSPPPDRSSAPGSSLPMNDTLRLPASNLSLRQDSQARSSEFTHILSPEGTTRTQAGRP